jgi:hypothetical protein
MRSQANTTRLLDDNPTLMRLRELEVLERVRPSRTNRLASRQAASNRKRPQPMPMVQARKRTTDVG